MQCRDNYRWNYQRQVYANTHINGKGVKLKLDTGATCNVLKRNGGSRVKPYGKCTVKVTNPRIEKTYDIEFVVIQDAQNSILGSATVQQMGLLIVHHEMIQKLATDKEVKPRSKEHTYTHIQCCRSIIQCLRRQLVF